MRRGAIFSHLVIPIVFKNDISAVVLDPGLQRLLIRGKRGGLLVAGRIVRDRQEIVPILVKILCLTLVDVVLLGMQDPVTADLHIDDARSSTFIQSVEGFRDLFLNRSHNGSKWQSWHSGFAVKVNWQGQGGHQFLRFTFDW